MLTIDTLVVHFCSAPLVCFVDALDNASQRPSGWN